jgi:hypothetical protein
VTAEWETGRDRRDQAAFLRQLAVDALRGYTGGFAQLRRIDERLKSIIWALEEFTESSWVSALIGQWGRLEIIYASALAHDRNQLTEEEEVDVREAVADLLAEFQAYELPLHPDEKPREHDAVRLLRTLPEHNLPACSIGTVVVDYPKYSEGTMPAEYEVEFSRPDGMSAMLTVAGADLKVVSRPGYGQPQPS